MSYVKHIKSNFKGDFEHLLGAKTIICGANATGKSRVVDAISLALTGKPRSLYMGTRERELLAMKPEGAVQLFVQTTLSNGETCEWSCQGTTTKAKRAMWFRPSPSEAPGAIVSDVVTALITGSSVRLLETLVSGAQGSVDRAHVIGGAPEGLRDLLGSVIRKAFVGDGPIPITAIAAAIKALDSDKKQQTKTIKSLQERLEAIKEEPLTDAELAVLENMRRSISGEKPAAIPDVDALRRQANQLRTSVTQAQGELSRLGQSGAPDTAVYELLSSAHRLLEMVAKRVREAEATKARCIVCGEWTELSVICSRIDKIAENLTKLESQRRAFAARAQCVHRISDLNVELARVATAVRQAEETAASAAKAQAGGVSRERYEELLTRNRTASEAVGLRDAIHKAETKAQTITGAHKHLGEVLRKTLDEIQKDFCTALNSTLPPEYEAELSLRTGTRDVCDLLINGQHIKARSGAERAIVCAAACRALLNGETAPVRMVIVDETWLDADHLGALAHTMGALVDSGTITQTIICAVNAYSLKDEPPEGWTVVSLP